VLDVYHVSEHLHACGRGLHGEQTPAVRAWADGKLPALLAMGPISFLAALAREKHAQRKVGPRRAIQALIDYLRPNVDGLWYARRLAWGLPIGSGLVEGACKNVLGRRLKCNSARWLPQRAEDVAALC